MPPGSIAMRPALSALPRLSRPLRRLAALVAVSTALCAQSAAALSLECTGPGTRLDVEVEPAAGRCSIDGTRASLRKPYDPVVCHLSTPKLRILTIGTDGSFTWEDTDSHRVVRGTCAGF